MQSISTTSDRAGSLALPSLAIMASLASQNLGAAFAKTLFPAIGTEGVSALRITMAAVLLFGFWRPWRIRLDRSQIGNLIAYGATLGLMNLLFYRAVDRIPIGVAVAIEVTGPLAVVLFSSRSPRDFLWLGLVVTGLSLLLPWNTASAALDPAGIAYAFGAALCWALYIVFGKRVSVITGGHAVAWGMLVATAFALPLGIAGAGSSLLAPDILLRGLGVAALASAIPYSLEMVALRGMPRQVFGILVSAVPATGALAGFLVLGERLDARQWIAIGCIVAASAGSALFSNRNPSAPPQPEN